jgi:hypothetical protein
MRHLRQRDTVGTARVLLSQPATGACETTSTDVSGVSAAGETKKSSKLNHVSGVSGVSPVNLVRYYSSDAFALRGTGRFIVA